MKVLFTVHQFFPEYAAGTEVLCYSSAKELIARGHEVRVLTASPTLATISDESKFCEYQYDGIKVYRYAHSYSPSAERQSMVELSFDNKEAAKYFSQILEEYKPYVVHFFHLNRLGTGLIDCAVQTGVPAYFTPTDFWAICPTAQLILAKGNMCGGPNYSAGNCVKHITENTQNGIVAAAARLLPAICFDWLAKLTKRGLVPRYTRKVEVIAISSRLGVNIARLNKLDRIVSPNQFMTDKLTQFGLSPKLIVQYSYGINVPAAQSSRQSIRHPLTVGYIGTLAPHKGCHVLIDAIKALPPDVVSLKIYGNTKDFPEYSEELLRLASYLNNVKFCGTFDNAVITEVLADIDVLVVPSLWIENTPLVVYSAQAARCPVIVSDFPGLTEVVTDQINGLVFKSGDSAALAKQISRLTKEPELLQQLSANAKQPKSTAQYVDELLHIWGQREDTGSLC